MDRPSGMRRDKDLSKSNVIFNGNGQQSPDNVAVRHSAIYNAQGDTGQSSAPIVVEDENDTPEYYNLQGIRVAAPSNGFYIVKQNGRFSKVYIR